GSTPAASLLQTIKLGPTDEKIAAGVEDYRIKVIYTIKESAEAIAIRPKLFPFAKSVAVTAYRPDNTNEVLIWAKDYNYDWQPEYQFKETVLLPKGTRVEVVAHLNNSDNNNNNPNHPARPINFSSSLCDLSFIAARRKGR